MLKKLTIRARQGIYVFPIGDIVYMEKMRRKICIHTATGQMEFYGRFPEVLPFLDGRFMYCHRSYIINMDHIVWMACNEIHVTTNESIPFGRDTYARARKIFTRYMAEKYPERNWDARRWL